MPPPRGATLDRGAASVRLFEVGRRYLADGERPTVGLLLAGDTRRAAGRAARRRGSTRSTPRPKSLALLEAAGAPVANLQFFMDAGETWHPGRSATLGLGKNILAAFGELHPRVAKALDIAGRQQSPPKSISTRFRRPAPSSVRGPPIRPAGLQSVTRDFAFMVPADLAADALVRAIRGADKAVITGARAVRPL